MGRGVSVIPSEDLLKNIGFLLQQPGTQDVLCWEGHKTGGRDTRHD